MAATDKKRVLIGAESYADAEAAMRLAERIASGLIAELGGLLVSDDTIADAVGLPAQRIVTSGGALLQTPSRQRFEALLESDARAFRSGLSGLARAVTVNWAFERRSGDLIAGICEAAPGWDLLLVGHRTAPKKRGRVLLIDRAAEPSPEAAEIAGTVAAALGMEVARLVVAKRPDATPPERAGFAVVSSENDLLDRVNRTQAALVVVDLAHGPLRGREQLRHLIEVARCPVLVLNAAQAEPALAHTTLIPESPAPGDAGTTD